MDYFVCGLEFGTDAGNPHSQITYCITTRNATSPAERKKLAAEEKRWLKAVVAEVCASVRVACKH
eukprot:2077822-Prymnesium_polylepis.1